MNNSKTDDSYPSKTFCILPWIHLFASEEGFIGPCCMTLEVRHILNCDENGNPFPIYEKGGIDKAWNSGFMKRLRKDMLSGKKNKICVRCFREEKLNILSNRQKSNSMFSHCIAPALQKTSPDGSSPLELLTSIDIRLGNICNLRCRMCTPVSSRALIPEWAELHGISVDHEKLRRLNRLNWFYGKSFWRLLEEYIPNIERLHFGGGEPLLISEMFDFLARLVETGKADDITLSYITNLSVLPERIYQLWPRFKRVSVSTSLDGIKEVNSLIRYPSRWKTMDRNLKALDRDAAELRCRDNLNINTTVQVLNIFRIDETIEYMTESFQHFNAPNLSLLEYPDHLNIRFLPAGLKEKAALRLKEFSQRLPEICRRYGRESSLEKLESSVHGIIVHMMSETRREESKEFVRFSNYYDGKRNQSVSETIPELAPLFHRAYGNN